MLLLARSPAVPVISAQPQARSDRGERFQKRGSFWNSVFVIAGISVSTEICGPESVMVTLSDSQEVMVEFGSH